jgi:PsbP-like protein
MQMISLDKGINSTIILFISVLGVWTLTDSDVQYQFQSVSAQPVDGASTNTSTIITNNSIIPTALKTYENPEWGISLQYPSNWTASMSGLRDYTELIAFYSPLQNLSESVKQWFPARLKISATSYNQNVSLPEYTNFVNTMLNQNEQVDVRSSSEATVAGYPGNTVVLAERPFQNNSTVVHMNTWFTTGNKVYVLTYEGEESTFNRNLPQANRVMESLRIATNNNNS